MAGILVVCSGNICRSPIAEGLLRRALERRLDRAAPPVGSAGTIAVDGAPAMLERSTFVEPVGRHLFDFDPDGGSVYAHLTACGVDLAAARHTIDAVPADETDADLLEVRIGTPLLRERRRAGTADGVPLEFGDDRYRPDRVTFTIDNARPSSAGGAPDLRILKESS